MGFVRVFLWSSFCVAFGVFLATFELSGKTILQHAQATWTTESPRAMSQLKSGFDSALQQARKSISSADVPEEIYGEDDRAAVNKLIRRGESLSKK